MVDKRTKVLCIEDNEDDVLLVKRQLFKNSNGRFGFSHSPTLKEGLEQLCTDPFDVVLLDLGLPDSSGLNTLMKLKQDHPEKPVLVMTGYDDETIGVKAVRKGAQDYLVKGQVGSDLLVRSVEYAIERKQMEEALRKSEEKLRIMFESVSDGMAVTDLKGKIIRANEALALMHGYSNSEELLGKIGFDLVSAKHRKKCIAEFKKTIADGISRSNEYMLSKKTGVAFRQRSVQRYSRIIPTNPTQSPT